jgi:hypothetical protein
VERIWKRQITGAAILFLINRYVTPLQFIIIIDGRIFLLRFDLLLSPSILAFNDPRWTKQVSDKHP